MRKRFDHVKGHDLGRELRIVRGAQPKAKKVAAHHGRHSPKNNKACCTVF